MNMYEGLIELRWFSAPLIRVPRHKDKRLIWPCPNGFARRASDVYQKIGDLVEDTFCLVNWDVVHEGRVCFGVIPEGVVN